MIIMIGNISMMQQQRQVW